MSGLQPGRLRWSFAKSEVKTFSEAMIKAMSHSDDGSKKRNEEGNPKDQPKQQKREVG